MPKKDFPLQVTLFAFAVISRINTVDMAKGMLLEYAAMSNTMHIEYRDK